MENQHTVTPLPAELCLGQRAVAITGTISLIASTVLFLHITYNLVILLRRRDRGPKVPPPPREPGVDLSLGLSPSHFEQTKGARRSDLNHSTTQTTEHTRAPSNANTASKAPLASLNSQDHKVNPLLFLIYNLIFADVAFSITYLINFHWLSEDAVVVGSVACRAQGWLVGFGCLISSGFLFLLAAYTFMIIVKGWRPSLGTTVVHSASTWLAAILVASIGPMANPNGDYFARQQFWCWIAGSNGGWRLSIYIWGFAAMGATGVMYVLTFWSLRKRNRAARLLAPALRLEASKRTANNQAVEDTPVIRLSGHHPSFLIYPLIYGCCATPMTVGSLTPLELNTPFMTFASILLASVGFFNAVLWATTIALSREEDMISTGLEHFRFMRTPEDRKYGNIVWVQGGSSANRIPGDEPKDQQGWWWWSMDGRRPRSNSDCELPLRDVQASKFGNGGASQGSGAIQMDVSTTVVVEDEYNRPLGSRRSLSFKEREP